MINYDTMREILLAIYRAWELQAKANADLGVDEDPLSLEEALEKVVGHKLIAQTLSYFAEWDNDLIAIGPFFGVGYHWTEEIGPVVLQNLPPPLDPSLTYYDYDLEMWVDPNSEKELN